MTMRILQYDNEADRRRIEAMRLRLRQGGLTAAGDANVGVRDVVREIIRKVQECGDDAVITFTADFDKVPQANLRDKLRVSQETIAAAHAAADAGFLALVRRVAANIRQYQQSILIQAPPVLARGGRQLGVRYTPIDRVGVYVPGGKAFYPSSVLMTVVPAQVAGVRQIALASPPTANGDVNPMVLALAAELGIYEIYRMSGAQAIAALACGTRSVPAVDMIAGPGNAFVAEAKKQLFGRVGIDSIAGPSEVLIIADDTARADWLAADLLAQAEHNPGSAVLVTTSGPLAIAVAGELDRQVATLERAAATRMALDENSCIVVAPDLKQAAEIANAFAPEHLQIITKNDDAVLADIRHAGAIFIGPWTPVPLGDYYAGPSHVLPTGGTARFFSPVSCNLFLKASSVIRYDAGALAADAADVIDFARREGLTAHARAIEIRKKK